MLSFGIKEKVAARIDKRVQKVAPGGGNDPRSMFREFAEEIAYQVKRVIESEQRRSAVV